MKTIDLTKQKGILVNVFENGNYDCTNNGVTFFKKEFILIGENGEDFNCPFKVAEDGSNILCLRQMKNGYKFAVPFDTIRNANKHRNGPMFGGNFIYTSDSRFPNNYPIPVHDRWEDF